MHNGKNSAIILISCLLVFNNKAEAQCDTTLWAHVYHSHRLLVNNPCITITCRVYSLIYEAYGGIHLRITLDSPFLYMLNSVNYSGQYGKLVCEPICATTCTQPDAISSCAGFVNTVYIP